MDIPYLGCYCAEFLGTYLFVLSVVCIALGGGATWSATAIGATLTVLVYAFAPISGAHLNPAVTLALAALGRVAGGLKVVLGYVAVQLLAGLLAGFSAAGLYGHAVTLGPGKEYHWAQAMIVEILYTMLLCFVVLSVTTKWSDDGSKAFGIAIGLVIVAGGYPSGAISGGAFNPAIALGIDVPFAVRNMAWRSFGWSLAYVAFELVGAGLAALLFMGVTRLFMVSEENTGDVQSSPRTSEASPLVGRLLCELVGTFFLTLTVGLNVLTNSVAPAMSIGAVLAVLVYSMGPISGAHLNPAVTTAVLLCGGDQRGISGAVEAGCYVVAQMIGAVTGGLLYAVMMGAAFTLQPSLGHGWGPAAVCEVVFTFILCFVVLSVTGKDSLAGDAGGLAVGLCIVLGATAVGSISGAVLNPALAFGVTTASLLHYGPSVNAVAYTCFELAGAVLAAAAYRVLRALSTGPEGKEKDDA